MRSSLRAGLAAVLFAAAGAGAQAPAPGGAAPAAAAAPTSAPALAAACAACHGPGGNSTVPTIPSIAGQPRVFVENQLVLIREGLRDIPAMKAVMSGVDDAQIVELARYYSAQTAVPPAVAVDAALSRTGAEVSSRALCGTCHLPGYVGQNQVPRIAGQHEPYLLATLKMYRDNPEPGRDTLMSAPLHGMSDADLAALAHHLATTR